MIVTIAHAKIQPEKRDAFLAAVPPFLKAARGEKGCIAYDLVECVDQANHFLTVERWEDRASMDAHMGQAHTREFLGVVGGCVSEAPTIEAMDVAKVDRVM